MVWCPFAVKQEIPESSQQNRIVPTTVIAHRAVSSAESLQNYWNSPGIVLESHFYIGQFGTIYQFVDTSIRADANVDANAFAISIETWDGGNTPDSMPWNDAQVAALKRLIAWCCDAHNIARRAATTWNGGGIGGHNWFPYPWADGPRGCPGTERNRQLREEIIPYVANGGGWQEEDELASSDEILAAVKDLQNDFVTRFINSGKTDSSGRVLDRVGWMFPAVDNQWITENGGIAPGTLTNAIASTYRFVFEQLDPRMSAMAEVLAQIAEDDNTTVSLSPAQLEALKGGTADTLRAQMEELQAQVEAQVAAGIERLADLLAQHTGQDRAAVLSALNEFYGRAVTG